MVATTTSRHVHLHVVPSPDVAANPKLPAAPSDSSQLSSSRVLRRAQTDGSPEASNVGTIAGGIIAVVAAVVVVAACAFLYYRRKRSRLAQREQERAREVAVSLEPVQQPLVLDFSVAARSPGVESTVAGHSRICVDPPLLSPISPTSPIAPPSPVLKPATTLHHRRSMMSFASEKSLFYQPPSQPLQALTTPIQTPTRAAHSFSISSTMTASKNNNPSSVSDTSRPTSPQRRSPPSTRSSTTGSRAVQRQHSRTTSSNLVQSQTDDQEAWGMTVEELLWRCSMIESSSPPSRSGSQSPLDLPSYQTPARSRKPSSTLEP